MTDWCYVIRQDTENWAGIWWRAGASSKPSVSVDLSGETASDMLRRQSDGPLFALALANLERAAPALLTEAHPAVLAYRGAFPQAKKVRDMLSHFDEYAAGKGRLQRSGTVAGFTIAFGHDGSTFTLHVAGELLRVEKRNAGGRGPAHRRHDVRIARSQGLGRGANAGRRPRI